MWVLACSHPASGHKKTLRLTIHLCGVSPINTFDSLRAELVAICAAFI